MLHIMQKPHCRSKRLSDSFLFIYFYFQKKFFYFLRNKNCKCSLFHSSNIISRSAKFNKHLNLWVKSHLIFLIFAYIICCNFFLNFFLCNLCLFFWGTFLFWLLNFFRFWWFLTWRRVFLILLIFKIYNDYNRFI